MPHIIENGTRIYNGISEIIKKLRKQPKNSKPIEPTQRLPEE
jgi:hypothetical protein